LQGISGGKYFGRGKKERPVIAVKLHTMLPSFGVFFITHYSIFSLLFTCISTSEFNLLRIKIFADVGSGEDSSEKNVPSA